jgi:hypothetical protein
MSPLENETVGIMGITGDLLRRGPGRAFFSISAPTETIAGDAHLIKVR